MSFGRLLPSYSPGVEGYFDGYIEGFIEGFKGVLAQGSEVEYDSVIDGFIDLPIDHLYEVVR